MSDVLLICMPFGPHTSPSIALSLLKAQLPTGDVSVRVRYFSIAFAERIGEARYSRIATDSGRPSIRELAGEWIFRDSLFGTRTDPEAYVEEILRQRNGWPKAAGKRPLPRRAIESLLRIRDEVEPFLDDCLAEIERERPKIVGFTSVFQQHVASLSLARRIKARLPETFIVMGGANCENAMGAETIRQFPFVDAVVSGEGDLVFPQLVKRVLAGEGVDDLPGVYTPANIDALLTNGLTNAPVVRDMDALPPPEYGDFFEQFEASRLSASWQPGLYFETSRGCWWGERMHCTFCGLNGSTMAFRSKSPERALSELTELTAEHPGCDVQVTDNILDYRYFDTLLPELAKARLPVDLFYETKSNLTRKQVHALRDANILKIQPGIESLSDAVLKLMKKGVSALQNIQLLKWCRESGVKPYWNLLWGFPGEPAEEYERMAGVVRSITHLQPPMGISGLRLDRFSPNFVTASASGFQNVRPLAPYRFIYESLADEALMNLAYYFDFDYADGRDVAQYVEPLLRAVRSWQRADGRDELLVLDDGSRLSLWDLRSSSARPLTVLEGIDRALYKGCDAAIDRRSLLAIARNMHEDATESLVDERLGPLVEGGLLLRDGNRYLALAVNVGEYQPPAETVARIKVLARELARDSKSSPRRISVPQVPATAAKRTVTA